MTKFEEEFDNCLHFGFIPNEQQNKIIEHFKDWQPQQDLPVVPECVGELFNEYRFENIQRLFEFGIDDIKSNKMIKALKWRDEHPDIFALAFITGKYEVEKPQLFYLREKNTNYYLNKSKNNGLELVPNPYFDEDNQFTQQEIGSMQTGSYEQIEVTE
ncbi:DUF1642 domain-containing protein [Lactococcus lactis]|uniref:DUF1642 domain-containing protein n=1 Tax=Lactococcus lactis TaxID=1358 RepID=UPI0024A9E305|nr:DUF1642 domain-containing protein [Lactococcus lactis]